MSQQLRRVRVVGNSGAGKTTFARRLADALDVPHLELDEVFWDAGWTKRDPDEARTLIEDFVSASDARLGHRRQLDDRDRGAARPTPTRSCGWTTRAGS